MANLLDFIIISSPRENSFKAVPEDLSSNFSLLIFFIYILIGCNCCALY